MYRLIQSPLYVAAKAENIEVVKVLLEASTELSTLLKRHDLPLPGVHCELKDAGAFDSDIGAISQAKILYDFIALKTLVRAAAWNADFNSLEACFVYWPVVYKASPRAELPPLSHELFPYFIDSEHPGAARRMAEIILDLKPGAPWGDLAVEELDNLEGPLLHIITVCTYDSKIFCEVVRGGRSVEDFHDKYYYMALCVAIECGDIQKIRAVLDVYDFEYSSYSRELKQRARTILGQVGPV
jgi:hypothetical protein